MSTLQESLDKQDLLREEIESKYTHSISSQASNASGNVVFNIPNHNFVKYDVLKVTGTDFDGYNDSFKVQSITNNDVELNVSYNASASVSGASTNSVRVYNNYLIKMSRDDFCAVMLDIDDTLLKKTAGNLHIPQETFYPIVIINSIDNFPEGDNVQVMKTRRYNSHKMNEILELIEDERIEVVPNVSRKETIWNNHRVSLMATTLQY